MCLGNDGTFVENIHGVTIKHEDACFFITIRSILSIIYNRAGSGRRIPSIAFLTEYFKLEEAKHKVSFFSPHGGVNPIISMLHKDILVDEFAKTHHFQMIVYSFDNHCIRIPILIEKFGSDGPCFEVAMVGSHYELIISQNERASDKTLWELQTGTRESVNIANHHGCMSGDKCMSLRRPEPPRTMFAVPCTPPNDGASESKSDMCEPMPMLAFDFDKSHVSDMFSDWTEPPKTVTLNDDEVQRIALRLSELDAKVKEISNNIRVSEETLTTAQLMLHEELIKRPSIKEEDKQYESVIAESKLNDIIERSSRTIDDLCREKEMCDSELAELTKLAKLVQTD